MSSQSYLDLRGIDVAGQKTSVLPAYMKRYLTDPGIRVLDFGCGHGRFLQALVDHGIRNVLGVDLDENAVDLCRSAGLPVETVTDMGLFSEREKGSFDLILMIHVLEHIEKEKIIPTLKLIRQLIAPGGKLLIAVPNAQSPAGCYWAYEDFTHTTIFTAGSLLYVLGAAGFDSMDLVDPLCLEGLSWWKRLVKKPLLILYAIFRRIVNGVTGSSYHDPSPKIWSFEVKMLARVKKPEERSRSENRRNS